MSHETQSIMIDRETEARFYPSRNPLAEPHHVRLFWRNADGTLSDDYDILTFATFWGDTRAAALANVICDAINGVTVKRLFPADIEALHAAAPLAIAAE